MNKARLEFFSDGVMAIAITLLAIEFKPFHVNAEGLADFLPHILLFVLSFVTIAIFWINHNHVIHRLGTITNKVLWANIVLLMSVTLIPFATVLLGENLGEPLGIGLYAGVFLLGAAMFYVLRRLIHGDSEKHYIARSLIGPACYALAIPGAFVSPVLGYVLVLLPPLYYFLPKHSA